MSEEQRKLLKAQLRRIANKLRGKINADEFIDYILGFIFYQYLCEKQYLYANSLLAIDTKIQLVNTQLEDSQQSKKGLL